MGYNQTTVGGSKDSLIPYFNQNVQEQENLQAAFSALGGTSPPQQDFGGQKSKQYIIPNNMNLSNINNNRHGNRFGVNRFLVPVDPFSDGVNT